MRYQYVILTLSLLFLGCVIVCGQDVRISGFVYDESKRTPIPDCHVHLSIEAGNTLTTVTDKRGRFFFDNLPKGSSQEYILRVTHINYKEKIVVVPATNSITLFLDSKMEDLEEVVVYSSFKKTNKGSVYTYTPREAASSISIIGEPDVIRHISSMPGVSQGMEGTLGLFVRGSNNGSNNILFNGMPIHSSSHLGMYSTFHPDVIDETSFYLGGVSAAFGNFSSALMDIKTKRKFGDAFSGNVSISPYMAGGYLSLPLKKNNISLQIGGRVSFLPYFIDQIIRVSKDEEEKEEMNGQLLDLTTLLDWKLNDKNTLNLMFYTTNDFFDYRINETRNKLNWNSTAFKMEWEHQFSSTIKGNITSYYTDFYARQEQANYRNNSDIENSLLRLGTELGEWSGKVQLSHSLSEKLSYLAGIQLQSLTFIPLAEKKLGDEPKNNKYDKQNGDLYSGYLELKYALPELITNKLGIRGSGWSINNEMKWNIELHLLTDIYLSKMWGIEITYDRFIQYQHVLEGLPTGWSNNVIIPADSQFPEEKTNQFYTGFFWRPNHSDLNINVTGGLFYRHMNNLVSYINSTNLFNFTDATWQEEVDMGKGESYGLELSAALQGERFGTTLAYTLSKTNRNFKAINNGETYPFKFDRRHIVNLQGKYTLKRSINRNGKKREQYINSVISFASGSRATLPIGSYKGVTPPYWEQRETGWRFPFEVDDNAYNRQIMSGVNKFKLKDYFR